MKKTKTKRAPQRASKSDPKNLFKLVGGFPLPVFDSDVFDQHRKPDGRRYFTAQQLAKQLGCSVRALNRLRDQQMIDLCPTLPPGEGRGEDEPAPVKLPMEWIGKFTPDALTLESFHRQFCHGFDEQQVFDALAIARARDRDPFRGEISFKLLFNEVNRKLEVVATDTQPGATDAGDNRLTQMTNDALRLLHGTLRMIRALTREGKALNCSSEWVNWIKGVESRLADATIDCAKAMLHTDPQDSINTTLVDWLTSPEPEPSEKTDQAQAAW